MSAFEGAGSENRRYGYLDTAWIGKKLRGPKNLPQAQGDFFAHQPGTEKQAVQPSTIAYAARLLIHRYEMLWVRDAAGYRPSPCPDCGHATPIRRDGGGFRPGCRRIGARG